MPSNPPADQYRIPTVEDLDRLREDLGLSRSELSTRAGRESQAWSEIVREDIDPQASTLRAFLDALRAADPDGERCQRGRPPRVRSDGGNRGDSA